MHGSTLIASTAIGSACMAVVGLWGFYKSFDPAPTHFQSFAGRASQIKTSTMLYSRSHATFQLVQPNGASMEFSYKPAHRLFYYFAEHVKEGSLVEVSMGPNGRQDIWGLKLDGDVLMSPQEALDVQRKDGLWGFALFLVFVASAVWLARLALKVRRQEVWPEA